MTGRGDEGVVRIKIKALTKAMGADSVLESVGTEEAMRQAINSRRKGGCVSYMACAMASSSRGEMLFYPPSLTQA